MTHDPVITLIDPHRPMLLLVQGYDGNPADLAEALRLSLIGHLDDVNAPLVAVLHEQGLERWPNFRAPGCTCGIRHDLVRGDDDDRMPTGTLLVSVLPGEPTDPRDALALLGIRDAAPILSAHAANQVWHDTATGRYVVLGRRSDGTLTIFGTTRDAAIASAVASGAIPAHDARLDPVTLVRMRTAA